ncbi:MAG: methyltransferase domain-containing protein [Betaproteobacteria bacterium]|nr:methyltransferase domain-containing protein [Betaproteobacteria bacterium]
MAAPVALDQVTLVCVDCVNVPLALQAMQRSMSACTFARAVLFTSAPVEAPPGIEVIVIPAIRSKREYSHFVVKQLPAHVRTSHALVIQWDGFVVRPEAWDPAFLDCDYIGAPWPPDLSPVPVGNGGFSLRSRRLLDVLLDPSFREEEIIHEDQSICVHFRERLENEFGIRFAPLELAGRFSHETTQSGQPTFGFHGPQNLWMYWKEPDLDEFLRTVSRGVLKHPEVVWLARHLYAADRLRESAKVAGAALTEQPDNSEILDILANIRDRRKPHDYKARSEQRFFLGTLKRQLPDYFRHRQVLEIGRPGAGATTQEWFEQCRFSVPNAAVSTDNRSTDGIEAYTAGGESFDVVVSCETLEHLPQWRDAIANAMRMLKGGGIMFLGCAGHGRRQHDSLRYPSEAWGTESYYRNLAPEDFAGIDFDGRFRLWTFLEDRTVHDLYFVGIGHGAREEHVQTLRRLLSDSAFLQKRRNVFGLY